MNRYRNFYYTITSRAQDVLLEIDEHPANEHPADAPHLYSNAYPDMPAAIVAAEQWIAVVHDTVLDYYRGPYRG